MKIGIITFTDRGTLLAEKIKGALGKKDRDRAERREIQIEARHRKESSDRQIDGAKKESPAQKSLTEWAGQQFAEKNAIVVIGACGIAVRMIAPFAADKLTDSPVVVADEAGDFVIPLLSGHMGGANALAEEIAQQIGAIPVFTTATDVNDTFSVDVFAKRCNLDIYNREGIAKVSAEILDGKKADIVISPDHTQLKQGILGLRPKEYILGVGCRKGKSFGELDAFFTKCLKKAGVEKTLIRAVASIDLKKDEEGLLRWCAAKVLARVEGDFTASAFVRTKTGVDNVCERAALAAADGSGTFVLRKTAENGMTAALLHTDWKLEKELAKEYRIDEQ